MLFLTNGKIDLISKVKSFNYQTAIICNLYYGEKLVKVRTGAAVKEQKEVAKIRGRTISGSGNDICTVPASAPELLLFPVI